MTKLSIKNMVCPRCVMAVEKVLKDTGLTATSVTIGSANVEENLNQEQIKNLDQQLRAIGFEILKNSDDALVERIKNETIALARRDDGKAVKISDELASTLDIDYRTLSATFSAHEQRTIEKFFIAQKVEHVKELLDYGELTVSEIAFKTGYSSVAHLSRQFKQVTGITPTEYKQQPGRMPIDQI